MSGEHGGHNVFDLADISAQGEKLVRRRSTSKSANPTPAPSKAPENIYLSDEVVEAKVAAIKQAQAAAALSKQTAQTSEKQVVPKVKPEQKHRLRKAAIASGVVAVATAVVVVGNQQAQSRHEQAKTVIPQAAKPVTSFTPAEISCTAADITVNQFVNTMSVNVPLLDGNATRPFTLYDGGLYPSELSGDAKLLVDIPTAAITANTKDTKVPSYSVDATKVALHIDLSDVQIGNGHPTADQYTDMGTKMAAATPPHTLTETDKNAAITAVTGYRAEFAPFAETSLLQTIQAGYSDKINASVQACANNSLHSQAQTKNYQYASNINAPLNGSLPDVSKDFIGSNPLPVLTEANDFFNFAMKPYVSDIMFTQTTGDSHE